MKILICGLGSIGKRHAKNLLSLGEKNIIFFRERNINLKEKNLEKIKVFKKLSLALKEKPDVTFVCNITSKHISTAIECAKNGSHLFIEKPVSNKFEKWRNLEKIIEKKKLKVMVGYNMRFHPLMIKIKKKIESNQLGKVYNVKSQWSEYLPDWHPWENFKKTYAANKEMGGGCSLTLSHELDTFYWLFGSIKKFYNIKSYNYLDIKVDTISDYLVQFKNNIVGYIHIDFLQRPHSRNLEITGTKKKLLFNFYKNEIQIISRNGKIIKNKIKFKKNEMYLNEIRYFLNCVKKNIKPKPDLNDSKYLLKKFLFKN